MYLTIFEGIEKQRLLEVFYEECFRIVEPHLYGRDQDGKDVLKAYQIAGGLNQESSVGWKLFDMSGMHHLACLSTQFAGVRRGFRAGKPALQKIYCQLDPLKTAKG